MDKSTETRLKNLEDTLQKFMESMSGIPTTLALIQQELSSNRKIRDDVDELKKAQEIELGAKKAVKVIWGILSVFIVAGVFGLFKMNDQLNRLELTIGNIDKDIQYAVQREVATYFTKTN